MAIQPRPEPAHDPQTQAVEEIGPEMPDEEKWAEMITLDDGRLLCVSQWEQSLCIDTQAPMKAPSFSISAASQDKVGCIKVAVQSMDESFELSFLHRDLFDKLGEELVTRHGDCEFFEIRLPSGRVNVSDGSRTMAEVLGPLILATMAEQLEQQQATVETLQKDLRQEKQATASLSELLEESRATIASLQAQVSTLWRAHEESVRNKGGYRAKE